MARVCSLYHGVGLFSLIFLKRKGATVSKVLEKRESIVSVTSSSCSELLDMLQAVALVSFPRVALGKLCCVTSPGSRVEISEAI